MFVEKHPLEIKHQSRNWFKRLLNHIRKSKALNSKEQNTILVIYIDIPYSRTAKCFQALSYPTTISG